MWSVVLRWPPSLSQDVFHGTNLRLGRPESQEQLEFSFALQHIDHMNWSWILWWLTALADYGTLHPMASKWCKVAGSPMSDILLFDCCCCQGRCRTLLFTLCNVRPSESWERLYESICRIEAWCRDFPPDLVPSPRGLCWRAFLCLSKLQNHRGAQYRT